MSDLPMLPGDPGRRAAVKRPQAATPLENPTSSVMAAAEPVDTRYAAATPPEVYSAEPTNPQAGPSAPVFGGSLDRLVVKRDPTSTAIATAVNVLVVLAALYFTGRSTGLIKPPVKEITTLVAPPPPPPPPPRIQPKAVLIGGGGGQVGPTPVTRGNPPKFDPKPLIPPTPIKVDQPKLALEPSVDVQKDLKMAHVDTTNFGVANAPNVGLSMGNGRGGGLGSGNGNGIGPGSGGNTGGGLRKIGGGVSAPVPIYTPEPEFSEEARKAKVSGAVLVYLQVDTNGNPSHVRLSRGIGMGLDEKAIEAVKKYKFRPAMENGKPVPVELNIEVNFQIF